MESISNYFLEIGGKFTTDVTQILIKLPQIKAFVFDWDGVFNDGTKSEQMTSSFAEADSMGTNILRFSYWLSNQKMPPTAIISGESNSSSLKLATRENFNQYYFKFANKIDPFLDFCKRNALKPDEVAFVFDDVIDLSVAKICGLRFLVRRKGSPMMTNFAKNNDLCDYITGCYGGEHAVREVCELIMGLNAMYDKAVEERMLFSDNYKKYIKDKGFHKIALYTFENNTIVRV